MFAEFWMRALFSIDLWFHNQHIRLILDSIFEVLFFLPGGHVLIQSLLRDQFTLQKLRDVESRQKSKFLGWLSGGGYHSFSFALADTCKPRSR